MQTLLGGASWQIDGHGEREGPESPGCTYTQILDGPRGAQCNAQACTRYIADKWLQRSMPIEDLTMVHVSLLGDIY
jgi:hypothetical protein